MTGVSDTDARDLPGTLPRARVRSLIALLLLASLPAGLAPEVGASMHALIGDMLPAGPYFSSLRPGLLYFVMPISVTSASILLMAPGLFIALARGRTRSWAEWLLEGFAWSLLLVSATAGAVQAVLGAPLSGRSFFGVVLTLAAAAALLLERRSARAESIPSPFAGASTAFALISVLVIPTLLAVALTPKIFWEAFNGDGAHAFESTRLLLHQALPFWSPVAGDVSSWPGMAGLVSVYQVSWFLRLFGENEAAVRLPLLMNLGLLFAALVAAIEAGRARLEIGVLGLLWGGVVSFGLVMSYSATYDPYCADMSMPGVMDTLVMVLLLAAAAAHAKRSLGWLFCWSLLALMTGPAGLFSLGAALVGLTLASWPPNWKRALPYAGALFGCLVALTIAPIFVGLFGFHAPGGEHGPIRFLSKFGFIATADVERIAWALLPAGIYPVVVAFAWRRSDELSRILLVVSAVLFAMYYVMGFVSLHYFVPVMLLPLVAFWRSFDSREFGMLAWGGCTAGVTLALFAGLPASSGIYTGTRTIGQRISVQGFPGYSTMAPEIFAASQRLEALFPKDMADEVPAEAYGGSPLAWLYYAERPTAASAGTNYVLAAASSPEPEGFQELYRDELAAVYVQDRSKWQEDRHLQPTNSNGQWVYQVDRNRLFNRGTASKRLGFFGPGHWVLRKLGMNKEPAQ